MLAQTIFDDLRLPGASGLSFQTATVPVTGFVLDGMGTDSGMATAIFTVQNVTALRAFPTIALPSGSTIAFTRDDGGEWRLDVTSGLAEDLTSGILSSDNINLQWFRR